jgi:hypothetical protein
VRTLTSSRAVLRPDLAATQRDPDGAVKQREPPAKHRNDSRPAQATTALLDRRRPAALPRPASPHPRKQHKRPKSRLAATKDGVRSLTEQLQVDRDEALQLLAAARAHLSPAALRELVDRPADTSHLGLGALPPHADDGDT